MKLTQDQFFYMTEAMQRYGGNFYSRLASALRAADPANREKIFSAFPEIDERYGPDSNFYRATLADFVSAF
jgi:hypothetical protein